VKVELRRKGKINYVFASIQLILNEYLSKIMNY